ncbi:hypothetical protein CVT24_002893 [Panaeolus cyanescens]|uniref:Uncharacterized protein n=1 Tax=Panaeolus cyanescens TaxID=181874 RepID=A0A409YXU4_9AGAR|nr:hypothetical protein CVT24_002893 [Panaeolus cyanescens]
MLESFLNLPQSTLTPQPRKPNEPRGYTVTRYTKLRLKNEATLQCQVGKKYGASDRKYRWFEATPGISNRESVGHRFGEAVAFYIVHAPDGQLHHLAIYMPLLSLCQPAEYPTVIWGQWPESTAGQTGLFVMDFNSITDVVGIWKLDSSKNVYVLRKHPALLYLQPHELGVSRSNEEDNVDGAGAGDPE